MEYRIQKKLLKPTYPYLKTIGVELELCREVLTEQLRGYYRKLDEQHRRCVDRLLNLEWKYILQQIKKRELENKHLSNEKLRSSTEISIREHKEGELALVGEIDIKKKKNQEVVEQTVEKEKGNKLLLLMVGEKEEMNIKNMEKKKETMINLQNIEQEIDNKLTGQQINGRKMNLDDKMQQFALLKNQFKQQENTLKTKIKQNEQKLLKAKDEHTQYQHQNNQLKQTILGLEDQVKTVQEKQCFVDIEIINCQTQLEKQKEKQKQLRKQLSELKQQQLQTQKKRKQLQSIKSAISATLLQFKSQNQRIQENILGIEREMNQLIPILETQ